MDQFGLGGGVSAAANSGGMIIIMHGETLPGVLFRHFVCLFDCLFVCLFADVRQFAQALQSEFKAAETDQSEESPAEKKDGADKEPDPPAN